MRAESEFRERSKLSELFLSLRRRRSFYCSPTISETSPSRREAKLFLGFCDFARSEKFEWKTTHAFPSRTHVCVSSPVVEVLCCSRRVDEKSRTEKVTGNCRLVGVLSFWRRVSVSQTAAFQLRTFFFFVSQLLNGLVCVVTSHLISVRYICARSSSHTQSARGHGAIYFKGSMSLNVKAVVLSRVTHVRDFSSLDAAAYTFFHDSSDAFVGRHPVFDRINNLFIMKIARHNCAKI